MTFPSALPVGLPLRAGALGRGRRHGVRPPWGGQGGGGGGGQRAGTKVRREVRRLRATCVGASPSAGLALGSFCFALALVTARAADRRLLLPVLAASVPAPVAALAMADAGRWISFPLVLWVLTRATQRSSARPPPVLGGATWKALTGAADWVEAAALGWLLLASTPAPLAPLFQGHGVSALVALALTLVLWRPQADGTMAWVRNTSEQDNSGLGALLNLVLLTALTVANLGRVMLAPTFSWT